MNQGHRRPRILAVDDSEDLREFYEFELALAGYSVVLAADGRQGLELARELRPDVIITDVSMPVMDGLELLGRLRSDLAPPLPPIIVCSGGDMTEATALRLGAFRFLNKPFERADLLAVVTLALQGRAAADDTVATEKERIRKARERAAAAASTVLHDVDFAAPAVASAVQGFADWITEYYGFGATALAFVEGGDLRVRAVSRGSVIVAGTVFDGRTLYSSGVLASGASLVVSDASAYPFASERANQLGIRSFVGVPLLSTGIPVGTICLFDKSPRAFSAEDLLILEELGRGALQRLSALPPALERIGLLRPSTFHRLLAAELALHHRDGGSLDLVIVDHAAAQDTAEVLRALRQADPGPRLAASQRSADTLILFKRDSADSGASRTMANVLAALGAVVPLHAAGWVSLGSRLPSTSAQDLLELARGALEQARQRAPGTPGPPGMIERFELKREPWRGATPEPIAPS
jgi:CheY-like chemotaxis protein